MVSFERPLTYPAWIINCSVSAVGTPPNRFTINVPELLPHILTLFAHLVAPEVISRTSKNELRKVALHASIQQFCDAASEATKAYKEAGLASAIRTGSQKSNLTFWAFEAIADHVDSLTYLIVNHEIGHIYIEQLTKGTGQKSDAHAFEYFRLRYVTAVTLSRIADNPKVVAKKNAPCPDAPNTC